MSAASSPPLQYGKQSYFLACIIRLLTTAQKLRLPGLVILLLFSFINGYLLLFDQQSYIYFVEFFSPDGKVSDINAVFFRIQTLIIYLCITWILATKQSVIDSLVESSEATKQPNLQWQHRKLPYIIAYIIWLLISYLPFLLFDSDTTRMLIKEDSFYENSGFLWLLLTSMSFFYLFFRKKRDQKTLGLETGRNIFFLLLGLLFFIGAGEEISWGQRIFHFKTPDIMDSNLQHEFNLHNMPLLDPRTTTHKDKNSQHITLGNTGIAIDLSINYLFRYFWFSFCVLIPVLYIISISIHKWLNKINFPIVPIWAGLLFLINYYLYYQVIKPEVGSITEVRETTCSFLFFVLALWFINSQDQRQHHDQASS